MDNEEANKVADKGENVDEEVKRIQQQRIILECRQEDDRQGKTRWTRWIRWTRRIR